MIITPDVRFSHFIFLYLETAPVIGAKFKKGNIKSSESNILLDGLLDTLDSRAAASPNKHEGMITEEDYDMNTLLLEINEIDEIRQDKK